MNPRRRRFAARAVLLCAGWLILGLTPAAFGAAPDPLPVTLSDPVAGGDVELSAGAPLLHVVFFATWCPTCVEELDRLADLQQRWEQSGYELIIVAVATRQDPRRLARFAAEQRPPGRLLHDPGGGAQRVFGAESLPAHFLFDEAGKLILGSPALDESFVSTLERYLREREMERGE